MFEPYSPSGISDGDHIVDGGSPVGFVLRFPNDFVVYHSGDTDVFESMRVIGRRFQPDVALLPIGGHYTMDPTAAAEAIRLLGVTRVIPIHYGTFPILSGNPSQLQELVGGSVKVLDIKPGDVV